MRLNECSGAIPLYWDIAVERFQDVYDIIEVEYPEGTAQCVAYDFFFSENFRNNFSRTFRMSVRYVTTKVSHARGRQGDIRVKSVGLHKRDKSFSKES